MVLRMSHDASRFAEDLVSIPLDQAVHEIGDERYPSSYGGLLGAREALMEGYQLRTAHATYYMERG